MHTNQIATNTIIWKKCVNILTLSILYETLLVSFFFAVIILHNPQPPTSQWLKTIKTFLVYGSACWLLST